MANMDVLSQADSSLANLRDIHMPASISAWPPGPGWMFLILIIASTSIFAGVFILKNYKVWQVRKHALYLLKKYKKQYPKIINSQRACSLVNELLKKTAFYYYPRTTIASLTGKDWIDFLNSSMQSTTIIPKILKSKRKLPTFDKVNRELLEYPYQSPQDIDLDDLFNIAKIWIQSQKRLSKIQRESLCSH